MLLSAHALASERHAATPDKLVAERFRLLLEHLADGEGRRRGWQRRVAERLGVHPPDVTNLLSGKRQAGRDLALRVAERIGLDPRFFSASSGAAPEDWLREMAARGETDEERLAFEVKTLAELRTQGRDLRRMLDAHMKESPHPRIVAEGRALAERVLASRLVRTANGVLTATPQRQLAAIREFVVALDDGDSADARATLSEPAPADDQSPEEDAAESLALPSDAHKRAKGEARRIRRRKVVAAR